MSYKTQPNNCILVPPFEFIKKDSENDDYLYKLELYLDRLKNLNASEITKIINKK